jgi:hypothetical protein
MIDVRQPSFDIRHGRGRGSTNGQRRIAPPAAACPQRRRRNAAATSYCVAVAVGTRSRNARSLAPHRSRWTRWGEEWMRRAEAIPRGSTRATESFPDNDSVREGSPTNSSAPATNDIYYDRRSGFYVNLYELLATVNVWRAILQRLPRARCAVARPHVGIR